MHHTFCSGSKSTIKQKQQNIPGAKTLDAGSQDASN
jgi:hypothetical protein